MFGFFVKGKRNKFNEFEHDIFKDSCEKYS